MQLVPGDIEFNESLGQLGLLRLGQVKPAQRGLPRVVQLQVETTQTKRQNGTGLVVGRVDATLGRVDAELESMRGTLFVLFVDLDRGGDVLNAEEASVRAALGYKTRIVQGEVELHVLRSETADRDLGDGPGVLGQQALVQNIELINITLRHINFKVAIC